MATKDEITSKINSKIVKDGNIRAVDTNEILRDILDFSNTGITQNTTNINNIEQRVIVLENKPETDNYKPFSFWDENPIADNNGLSQLWYSFKGISKESVNFTFKFVLLKPDSKKGKEYNYKLNDKIVKELKSILIGKDDDLTFIVPGCYNDFYSNHVCLNISLIEDTLKFRFSDNNFNDNNFDNGFNIFTSIHFHCPPFNFDRK
jgi:hypothetical protein